MKVPYSEGLANHTGPESCVYVREEISEALTRESAGQVLSRERKVLQSADVVYICGRQYQTCRYREMRLDSAWSETLCTHGNFLHGNREISRLALSDGAKVRVENPNRQNKLQTQGRESLSHALGRIRRVATKDKEVKFTALWHHVYNVNHLRVAFYAVKRKASPGVDGETWHTYEENLEINLQKLSTKLRNGAYHAKPVCRVYIPKPDGRQRPLGVTALEDKLVQRATVQVLEAVYETDFKGFSYGFRPKRSTHDALDALAVWIITPVRCMKDIWLDTKMSGRYAQAVDMMIWLLLGENRNYLE